MYGDKLTNFESVGQFHEIFGHPKPSTLKKHIDRKSKINTISFEFDKRAIQ